MTGSEKTPFWRKAATVFHEEARAYDGWFEKSLLFEIELAALDRVQTPLAHPRLEIGVGPGRFAEALDVGFGVDPALAPLALAARRGVCPAQALGEALPYAAGCFGTLYLLFTLCFLADPQAVLAECRRVLRPGGHLVLGFIPARGNWGRLLARKGAEGHAFYRYARFYGVDEVERYLAEAGFVIEEQWSTLWQAPDALQEMESAKAGGDDMAGFVVLVAGKRG